MTAPTAANVSTLSDFSGFFTPEQSEPIFERAMRESAAQALATRVPLGITGKNIPVVTGEPTAGWVNEGDPKPITTGGMALKNMQPKKLAAIFVMSAEVVRADPANYSTTMRNQMAQAFGKAFDSAVFHGTNTPFADYLDETPHAVVLEGADSATANAWTRLNDGLDILVNDTTTPFSDGRLLNGFAFDTATEPILNGSLDAAGRPLFVDTPLTETNPTIRPGRVMGRTSVIARGVSTPGASGILGYGGDWTQVVWGSVGGISFDVSTEATLPIGNDGAMVSLWQNNLVAVRAEAEYGVLINDLHSFVKYTRAAA